jgi:hypothetical protein
MHVEVAEHCILLAARYVHACDRLHGIPTWPRTSLESAGVEGGLSMSKACQLPCTTQQRQLLVSTKPSPGTAAWQRCKGFVGFTVGFKSVLTTRADP